MGDVFKAAKEVDLEQFLIAVLNPVKQPRHGKWERYNACPACGEGSKDSVRLSVLSGGGYWSCFRCENSGDVIEAAAHIWGYGLDKYAAAERLVREFGNGNFEFRERTEKQERRRQESEDDQRKQAALERIYSRLGGLDTCGNLPKPVMDYLCLERCLPHTLVQEAVKRGMIRSLPADPRHAHGLLATHFAREELEIAGLWKPESKFVGVAYKPLMFPLPCGSSCEFRIIKEQPTKDGQKFQKAIRHGSAKKPWTWKAKDPTKPTLICEGAIDMLSAVAMGFQGNIIALPGVNQWRNHVDDWLGHLIGQNVIICFDNDDADGPIPNPGQHWAAKLEEALLGLKVKSVFNRVLPLGEDINDILKQRRHTMTAPQLGSSAPRQQLGGSVSVMR